MSQIPGTIVLRRDRDLESRRNDTGSGAVLQDGKLIDRNMKRERLTEDEVAEEMRAQQIASVEDVEWGILESDGNTSFIPK